MHFTAFETNNLLQAIGLGMLHSIWQTALLCIVYFIGIHPNKKYTAAYKYTVAMLLLIIATIWFSFSVVHHYYLLANQHFFAIGTLHHYLQNFFKQYTYCTPYIATIYLTAVGLYVGKIIYQTHTKQPPYLAKPSVAIKLFTKQSALLLGIKKNVQIWLTSSIDVPQVKGLMQPIILLPVTIACNLNSQQIEAIILHELAHVKRNDYAFYIVQLIANAILIFNPFAQLLQKAINNQREYSCDDLVLHFKYNKTEYATALYLLEKNRHKNIALSLAATNNKNGLLQRIKRIIEPTALQPNKNAIWPYFLLLTSCCICLLMYRPIVCNNNPLAFYMLNKKEFLKTTNIKTPITKKNTNVINETQTKSNLQTYNPLKITTVALKKTTKPLPQMILLNKQWIAKKQKSLALYASEVTDEAAAEAEENMQNLVKIEEEQSGSSNKILYYFEVNNIGGKPIITPIYLATTPAKKSNQNKKVPTNNGIAY